PRVRVRRLVDPVDLTGRRVHVDPPTGDLGDQLFRLAQPRVVHAAATHDAHGGDGRGFRTAVAGDGDGRADDVDLALRETESVGHRENGGGDVGGTRAGGHLHFADAQGGVQCEMDRPLVEQPWPNG